MKLITCLIILLFLPVFLFAEEDTLQGKEIQNLVSAVKTAETGDYILLPSGNKYVLTEAEINIANRNFDILDMTGAESTVMEDGTEVVTISQAHSAYIFPDGQEIHLFKTSASFNAFLELIETCYYIALYVDDSGDIHDYREIKTSRFDVFRAAAQLQIISNGIEELDSVSINVYNYNGKSYSIKFCSVPEMVWGNISQEGMFLPVGEIIEFKLDADKLN